MPVITFVYDELKKAWGWVKTEATDIYNLLKPLVNPALAAFDGTLVQDLWGAAAAFVSKLIPTVSGAVPFSLADLETGFLNTLVSFSSALLSAAQTLGSSILQTMLGLFQSKLTTAPAA
jgi:hypothetical protein